jgi:hypothetical protein
VVLAHERTQEEVSAMRNEAWLRRERLRQWAANERARQWKIYRVSEVDRDMTTPLP